MKKYVLTQLRRGFTIVDFLITIFIIGALVSILSIFTVYYFKNYSFSIEEQLSLNEAQQGVYTMVHEIREARSGDNGAWTLVQTDDNAFTFFSDVTDDGRPDRVRYFLQGSELKKGVIQPTQVPVTYPSASETIRTIAYDVDNAGQPIFTYYNGDWPQDTINNPLMLAERLLDTRFIQIYLRININPTNGSEPLELSSGVQIRSLKDNL